VSRRRRPTVLPARKLIAGYAEGEVLATGHPLTFWGGIDPSTAIVIEAQHELRGQTVTGKILVFPRGAGSSSGCGVLMEMLRRGNNPAAIINIETEAVLALGPIIAQELYGRSFPIVTVKPDHFTELRTGDRLIVDADAGQVRVQREGA
jgi:predicted aconitase with swiveling domain